ncbi:MAG: hypothetical protein U0941_16930 [Planctomycetaceae bacterium]
MGEVTETIQVSAPALMRRTFPRVAFVCALLGCIGWCGTFMLMGNIYDGEQLAGFFNALFNVVFLGVFGGISTTLSSVGLLLTRQHPGVHRPVLEVSARWLSWAGLALGILISLVHFPGSILQLH